MAALLLALGSGWLLGLSVAAPLGPTGLESIRRSVRGGFWQGFLVGAGATSIDTLYLLTINLGLGTLLAALAWARRLMWLAGAVVLGFLGLRGLLGHQTQTEQVLSLEGAPDAVVSAAPPARELHPALAGALITGMNPVTIGLWLAVGATALTSWQARGTGLRLLFTTGIISGLLSWFVILAALASRAGQWLTQQRRRRLDQAAGLMLLGFAIYFIIQAWGG